MTSTVMTEPASEITGEANVSNVSLVLRKIADTPAGISEEQLVALSRLLVQGNRMFLAGAGSSGRRLIGPQQQGGPR